MANGLKVVSLETYSPKSRVGLFIDAASRHETPETLGITHMLRNTAFLVSMFSVSWGVVFVNNGEMMYKLYICSLIFCCSPSCYSVFIFLCLLTLSGQRGTFRIYNCERTGTQWSKSRVCKIVFKFLT